MKKQFFFTAFGLLYILTVVAGEECSVGETKKEDCNECFCTNGHWACTLMACSGPEHIQLKREVLECVPGEFKKLDCNNCGCVQGHWACTRKACLRFTRDLPECDEGEFKQVACNSCKCAKGNWVCTRKFCLKKKRELPTKVLADLKNVPCSPTDTFFLDCNRCQCNFERTGYTCVKAQNCTLTT